MFGFFSTSTLASVTSTRTAALVDRKTERGVNASVTQGEGIVSRVGKGEPTFNPQIVSAYFERFTSVITIAKEKGEKGPPRKDIRINGVEVDSQDSDWDYLKRLKRSQKVVTLATLDRLLCRFDFCLSDFELFYEEKCLG